MFRLLSALSVYFLSQMVFKDLMRKLVTPFFLSTSVGLVRYTMKIVVLALAGTALLTTGFIFTTMELVRLGTTEAYFIFTPMLISGLIFLGLGVLSVTTAVFSRLMVPRSLRVNQQDQAVFLDSILGTVQAMIRDMEKNHGATASAAPGGGSPVSRPAHSGDYTPPVPRAGEGENEMRDSGAYKH